MTTLTGQSAIQSLTFSPSIRQTSAAGALPAPTKLVRNDGIAQNGIHAYKSFALLPTLVGGDIVEFQAATLGGSDTFSTPDANNNLIALTNANFSAANPLIIRVRLGDSARFTCPGITIKLDNCSYIIFDFSNAVSVKVGDSDLSYVWSTSSADNLPTTSQNMGLNMFNGSHHIRILGAGWQASQAPGNGATVIYGGENLIANLIDGTCSLCYLANLEFYLHGNNHWLNGSTFANVGQLFEMDGFQCLLKNVRCSVGGFEAFTCNGPQSIIDGLYEANNWLPFNTGFGGARNSSMRQAIRSSLGTPNGATQGGAQVSNPTPLVLGAPYGPSLLINSVMQDSSPAGGVGVDNTINKMAANELVELGCYHLDSPQSWAYDVEIAGSSGFTPPSLATIVNAGYIVVSPTAIAGQTKTYAVDPTGVTDSTAGIQAAIDDGCLNFQPVYLPNQTNGAQAIYLISHSLLFLEFDNTNNTKYAATSGHSFLGATNINGQNPIIRINASATDFNAASPGGYPIPMIHVHGFSVGSGSPGLATDAAIHSALWADPYANPPNSGTGAWSSAGGTVSVWDMNLMNINLDTNSKAWACGMLTPGAQTMYFANINITATNSQAGVVAPGGGGSIWLNFNITGGIYGVNEYIKQQNNYGQHECVFVGLTYTGDTHCVAAVAPGEIVGGTLNIVGFKFDLSAATSSAVASKIDQDSLDNWHHIAAFHNGQVIGNSGTTAFPNPNGFELYLEDVYIKGFTNVTKFAGNAAQACGGTWTQVTRYVCTSQQVTASIAKNIINGTTSTTAEPDTSITTSSSAPPTTQISRHLPFKIPTIDNTPFVDIRDFGALPLSISGAPTGGPTHNYFVAIQAYQHDSVNTTKCATAFQKAIAAAPAGTAVLIPNGFWEIEAPIVCLASTMLMGVGNRSRSMLGTHISWTPTAQAAMITTPNVGAAATFAAVNFKTIPRRIAGPLASANGPYANDWFTAFDWQCGGQSFTFGFNPDAQFITLAGGYIGNPLYTIYLHGANAGGRFYGMTLNTFGIDCNTSSRSLYGNGTQQPIYLYSANWECAELNFSQAATFNVEFVSCKNIRIYGVKREGHSETLGLTSCDNVGFFGSCRLSAPYGQTEIFSGCTNIVCTFHVPFDTTTAGNYIINDHINSVTLAMPNLLSYYKIGNLTDSSMLIASTAAPVGATGQLNSYGRMAHATMLNVGGLFRITDQTLNTGDTVPATDMEAWNVGVNSLIYQATGGDSFGGGPLLVLWQTGANAKATLGQSALFGGGTWRNFFKGARIGPSLIIPIASPPTNWDHISLTTNPNSGSAAFDAPLAAWSSNDVTGYPNVAAAATTYANVRCTVGTGATAYSFSSLGSAPNRQIGGLSLVGGSAGIGTAPPLTTVTASGTSVTVVSVADPKWFPADLVINDAFITEFLNYYPYVGFGNTAVVAAGNIRQVLAIDRVNLTLTLNAAVTVTNGWGVWWAGFGPTGFTGTVRSNFGAQ